MKRIFLFFLVFTLFTVLPANSFADVDSGSSVLKQQKIVISISPDITIEFNGVKQKFRDANGRAVYPVIYNGSAYLPIRAISGLFGKHIEWDSASKTVYIGKTLSNPSGIGMNPTDTTSSNYGSTGMVIIKTQYVEAYLKPDVLIMNDFVAQSFWDVKGNKVYPINYNGSTYLPVRGISEMMDRTIEWESLTKIISIEDQTENTADNQDIEENNGTAIDKEISAVAKNLKNIFDKEELLYYEATSKTTSLKTAVSLEEKQQIASKISENLLSAQNLTLEIARMDTSQFTAEQLKAYDKSKAFIESTEYYIQILENIAYLAAQDLDYSMLAETFLYFAMDSQNKMEDARLALKTLE